MLSVMTVTGMLSFASSQAVKPKSLQKWPRLIGNHGDVFTGVDGAADYAQRRSVIAGGCERARVAVR